MTTPTSAVSREGLESLLARVREAKGPDRELDALLHRAVHKADPDEWWYPVGEGEWDSDPTCPYLTASVDAALALVERVLPGWVVADLSQNSRHAGGPWGCELACYFGSDPSKNRSAKSGYDHPTPALAILTAFLEALSRSPPQ